MEAKRVFEGLKMSLVLYLANGLGILSEETIHMGACII